MTTADELVAAIAKSGLLSPEALGKVRAAATSQADAKALARDLVQAGTLTRWQAAQLLHGYSTLTVGKYRLLDQIGSGETGRVYLAEHAQMNRRHAIKILSRRQTARPEVLKRFLALAQRASALEHRNLSHVYDVDQDGEKYYLVMEYVEGQNLQKLVEASGPLPLDKVIEIVSQAIDGLVHAHDKQVVHGDLKPTNLIVEASGTLKITDIGQGRLVESPTGATGEETTEAAALAAALYRAPELLDGKHAADPQCDVYSLGNVLCFLLTGTAARDGADASKLLSAVKGVPAPLAALCARMLAVDPAERPTLDAVQAELPAAARGAAGDDAGAKGAGAKGAGAKPDVAPMPKAKKTPVARAIAASDSDAAEVVASNAAPQAASDSPLPGLAGLAINAGPRSRAGKPAAKVAATKKSAQSAEAAGEEAPSRGDAEPKKSMAPVILVAAVGGGLFVLASVAVAVVVGLNWSKSEPKAAVAAVVSEAEKAKKAADEAAAMERDIAAAMAAIGETNPAPPAEANPVPVAASPAPAAATPAPPTDTASKTVQPTEPPPTPATAQPETAKSAPPAANPTAAASPEPANPVPAQPKPAQPEPVPLREPPTAEPAKPAAAPPPAASRGAAFAGLAKATSLPKLDPMMTDPPPEALAPFIVGPCPPETTAQLKGGEHAIRGGRTKFTLAEGKDDQSLGKWNVVMSGAEVPLTIAQFSIQNKQLAFQWAPDGAKHEYSPFLCNCKLILSAGTDQHELALREPLQGESLLVDLEKPGATAKWNLDYLPDPKKLVVEVSRLGEAFPPAKFVPSTTMESLPAETLAWTGTEPENALLGIKFESSQTPKFVQVKATAQLKIAGKAEPLIKRKLQDFAKGIDSRRFALIKKQEGLEKSKPPEGQKKLRDAALEATKKELDSLAATEEQTKQLQQLMEDLKGKSEVHFRVYYLADDTQVDLVITDQNPPPEKKADPKEGAKK